ncbi:GNAT family N-acetyltransferase [Oscillospiraceae bacterium PP1C4]
MYQTKIISPSCDLTDALFVRDVVFTKEQGFADPDSDEFDPVATHVVLCDGDKPIATGRTYCSHEDTFKLGRIAVIKEYRGQELGRAIISELERLSIAQGAKQLTLGAQLYAVPFYQKCGFISTGERYMDEFCEHETLLKNLT